MSDDMILNALWLAERMPQPGMRALAADYRRRVAADPRTPEEREQDAAWEDERDTIADLRGCL